MTPEDEKVVARAIAKAALGSTPKDGAEAEWFDALAQAALSALKEAGIGLVSLEEMGDAIAANDMHRLWEIWNAAAKGDTNDT